MTPTAPQVGYRLCMAILVSRPYGLNALPGRTKPWPRSWPRCGQICWDVHLTLILPLSYQAHDHGRLWVKTCQFPYPRIFREIGQTDTPGLCIKKPNPAVPAVPAVHGVEGVQAVVDYIETELSPEEVLDAMASVILSRNRHSNWTLGMGYAKLCHCHCRCLSLLMIVIIIIVGKYIDINYNHFWSLLFFDYDDDDDDVDVGISQSWTEDEEDLDSLWFSGVFNFDLLGSWGWTMPLWIMPPVDPFW